MAELIAVVGKPGTGKSTAASTLNPEETFIITPSKIPAFSGSKKNYTKLTKDNPSGRLLIVPDFTDVFENGKLVRRGLGSIIKHINDQKPEIKVLVIEDITHYFNKATNSTVFRSRNKGGEAFARWGDLAADAFNSLFGIKDELRDDLYIITIFHEEQKSTPDGEELKIKTPGNMLDKELAIDSYYNYMFFTKVLPAEEEPDLNKRYKFVTNNDGYRLAKTPPGAFKELEIPNDLGYIINRIREFEGLS